MEESWVHETRMKHLQKINTAIIHAIMSEFNTKYDLHMFQVIQ